MADPKPFNSVNDTPAKSQQIKVGCNELWSYAQQFSYLRLSDKQNDGSYKLIGLYAARARRISATYARFYLETEEGGDASKIGRYYWMALGAFASKTVACLLDKFQVQASYFFGKGLGVMDGHNIANGLGQGNLWLFGDIAPAHWFYNYYPQHFFNGMGCIHKRHCDTLIEPVKTYVKALPWSAKSLGKINDLAASPDLIKGFEFIAQIEKMAPSVARRDKQLKHLLAIADHEQRRVLQPLIYNDPEFNKWTARERDWFKWRVVRWIPPKYELVFAHQCETDDPDLKSSAPNDLIVENEQSRMDWIIEAAGMFHKLMYVKAAYMKNELSIMAGWKESPDAEHVY